MDIFFLNKHAHNIARANYFNPLVVPYSLLAVKDGRPFNRVWDRGSLVAIEPKDRTKYAEVTSLLLEENGKMLVSTLVYDESKYHGPPYSINQMELQRLYPAMEVSLLEKRREKALGGGLKVLGDELWSCQFLVKKSSILF